MTLNIANEPANAPDASRSAVADARHQHAVPSARRKRRW